LYHDADGEPIRRPVLAWRTNTELDSAVGLVAFGRSAALRDADDIERDTFLGYELPPATPPSPTAERRLCDYEDCDQEPVWTHAKGDRFCEEHCEVLLKERLADLRGKLAQAELELREAREELLARREIGALLANAAFNLGQDSDPGPGSALDADVRATLLALSRTWHLIER